MLQLSWKKQIFNFILEANTHTNLFSQYSIVSCRTDYAMFTVQSVYNEWQG